jgi:hypothetical protein
MCVIKIISGGLSYICDTIPCRLDSVDLEGLLECINRLYTTNGISCESVLYQDTLVASINYMKNTHYVIGKGTVKGEMYMSTEDMDMDVLTGFIDGEPIGEYDALLYYIKGDGPLVNCYSMTFNQPVITIDGKLV